MESLNIREGSKKDLETFEGKREYIKKNFDRIRNKIISLSKKKNGKEFRKDGKVYNSYQYKIGDKKFELRTEFDYFHDYQLKISVFEAFDSNMSMDSIKSKNVKSEYSLLLNDDTYFSDLGRIDVRNLGKIVTREYRQNSVGSKGGVKDLVHFQDLRDCVKNFDSKLWEAENIGLQTNVNNESAENKMFFEKVENGTIFGG